MINKWRGREFWIGAVDTRDGEILETHTHETAKSHDFHHSSYFSRNVVEAIDEGTAALFWFEGDRKVLSWDSDVLKPWRQKIKSQLGATTTSGSPASSALVVGLVLFAGSMLLSACAGKRV